MRYLSLWEEDCPQQKRGLLSVAIYLLLESFSDMPEGYMEIRMTFT